ncbi:MAG: hypothetical protein JJE10_10510, partial [Thermoleophilia bacterium]|nr:hypothetical protein [Thermoleophilia bacterium]
ETLIVILLVALVALFVAGMAAMAYVAIRTQNALMWFHKAGTNLAQHQQELARIGVDDKQADAAKLQAEANKTVAETQRESARKGPTGAQPQRITGG